MWAGVVLKTVPSRSATIDKKGMKQRMTWRVFCEEVAKLLEAVTLTVDWKQRKMKYDTEVNFEIGLMSSVGVFVVSALKGIFLDSAHVTVTDWGFREFKDVDVSRCFQ